MIPQIGHVTLLLICLKNLHTEEEFGCIAPYMAMMVIGGYTHADATHQYAEIFTKESTLSRRHTL
jgi:hypothetical protein